MCFGALLLISVEHLSLIRFRSFRMKLIFDFLDMAMITVTMALNIDSLIKRSVDIQSAVLTVRPYAPTISTSTTVSSLDEMQLTPVHSS